MNPVYVTMEVGLKKGKGTISTIFWNHGENRANLL